MASNASASHGGRLAVIAALRLGAQEGAESENKESAKKYAATRTRPAVRLRAQRELVHLMLIVEGSRACSARRGRGVALCPARFRPSRVS
eukprot:CAMPEP_0115852582 /NCGR_PEP_ID=MMETSP0287-20121206/13071_1 /TAXON_ID=412157 /ORGANISM="Chrysochromulina rotalis, Strain UIO044" /LENGTH=89 /DNA_ID=CAMNT_0003306649 /DNA_START=677 /DNA_END=943 /DNA_ORIENTATION=-